jgi:thiamine-phosphate pyrophosphorylase
MLTLARGLRARTHTLGADFIVNDRLDVALAAEADGVHLGQDDLPADVARTLMGPEAIVGVSTHSLVEAQAAREAGADYVGVGAMYESPTKPGSRVVGPAMVTTVKRVTGLPVVAIGGITEANAQGVVAAGADALAIIGVLADANDPALAAGRLRAAVGRGRGGK